MPNSADESSVSDINQSEIGRRASTEPESEDYLHIQAHATVPHVSIELKDQMGKIML